MQVIRSQFVRIQPKIRKPAPQIHTDSGRWLVCRTGEGPTFLVNVNPKICGSRQGLWLAEKAQSTYTNHWK